MDGFVAIYRIRISWLVGCCFNCGRRRRVWLLRAHARPEPADFKITRRDTFSSVMVTDRVDLFFRVGPRAHRGAILAHPGLARTAFRESNHTGGDSPLNG